MSRVGSCPSSAHCSAFLKPRAGMASRRRRPSRRESQEDSRPSAWALLHDGSPHTGSDAERPPTPLWVLALRSQEVSPDAAARGRPSRTRRRLLVLLKPFPPSVAKVFSGFSRVVGSGLLLETPSEPSPAGQCPP